MRQQNNDLMATGRDLTLSSAGPETLEITQFGGGAAGMGDGGAGQGQVNPLQKLHMLLKGRYKWAISLAVLGALGGAAAGFFVGKQIYVSYGQVQVLPVLPKVLMEGDGGVMPFFDSFVDSQVLTIQSQRVLDMAVQNDAWRATGQPAGPDMVEKMAASLKVMRARGSQVVQVGYEDDQPAVAQAAVRSVLEAYQKVASEQDVASGEKLLEILQTEQNNRAAQAQALRQRILSLAEEFGTDDLKDRYDFQRSELEKLDLARRHLQLQLAAIGEASNKPEAGGATTRPAAELQPAEIALRDPIMAQLLRDQRMIERRMALISRQQGPNHPELARARLELNLVNEEIEARTNEVRRLATSGLIPTPVPQQGGTAAPAVVEAVSPETLRTRLATVQKLYDQNRDDLLKLGQKRLVIDDLREQEKVLRDQIDQFKKRQEQLNLQDKVAGRIQIVSFGERPKLSKDMRIKLAGGMGFGGAALGFGVVVLLGLLDRRFRSPDELRTSLTGSPMLGVLPELPDDLSDPEQAALTAHFVHQIRTLLQIWDSGSGTQVFSITSPVSGTGKTSLTLALGVSFAASDSRTLLIDCDLIGGGLTTRANAMVKRKIGRILQREGLLTDKQLEEALKLASGSRRRLGEILVELGYLKESDLDSALVTQQKGAVGLLDAINGEDLRDCVAETGIPNLSILPLGGAQAHHASKVTPHNLRRVLNEARKHYDTVLIDTGPVPGSLEAAVVAAEVDGVILCVSRGEQRPLAEKCVQHLLSIGAKVAGVVFNRARTTDMSVYGTAVRTSMPATSVPATGGDSARFGPMAQAVTYGGGAPAEAAGNGAAASTTAPTESGKAQ